ncbi:hypothetical protein HK097_011357 [Rhizophlyctis rosea]|uniref:Uncharacterized protein n=1 Tax=Rhizophlyctis rosea TaxID=64517 RepID=A0AAD5WZ99_9FUNG|nr:hypothetical protein HK097_011357 [Rhizophlyctis rosea]
MGLQIDVINKTDDDEELSEKFNKLAKDNVWQFVLSKEKDEPWINGEVAEDFKYFVKVLGMPWRLRTMLGSSFDVIDPILKSYYTVSKVQYRSEAAVE